MEKPSFQIDGEILKLVDETAKKIGVSRSDFFRMAVNEKLYRLGVLSSNSNSIAEIGGA
ncbi:MAG: ribbon-helix-helix domain-containing protein [Bacillota bacterium]